MAVLVSGKMTKSVKAEITVSKMLNFVTNATTAQQEVNVTVKKITADIVHGRIDSTGSGFVS